MKAYPFLSKFVVTSLFGVRGSITTSEGYASTDHKGIDLVGQGDINVVACESGVVQKAKYGSGLGNYVWVAGDSGYGTIYMHLASMAVKVGDRVTAKQKLGVMGNTGNSSGPHLHFGVANNKDFRSYQENDWINPAIWFGMKEVSTIKGKTFDGSGYISGSSSDTTSNSSISAGYTDALIPSGEFFEVTDIVGAEQDILYGRKYRIFVDIDNGGTFDVSELRCKFEIVKTAFIEPNQSILTIYNLTPEDENKIIKEGQRIIIEAGYQGSQYGTIFIGNVIQPLRSKENGVDYLLTLVSMDSDRYAAYGLIGVSLVAEQTSRQATEALISKSSYQIGRGFITDSSITYPRGKVMFGMSKSYLQQIAKSENSTCYTEDGKVNVVSPEDVSEGTIISLGPANGLLGTPTQNDIGISCKSLLNPQLKINTLFHIENTKIENYRYQSGQPVRSLDSEGIYRIIKVTHVGDTRSNDWYTEIEAVSQAGLLPGMMSADSLYIW